MPAPIVALPIAPRLSTLDSFSTHPLTVIDCGLVASFCCSLTALGCCVGDGVVCWAAGWAETMRLNIKPAANELDSNFGLMSHLL
jgi:hypothetical protein